jgi:hypothetical protein
MPDLPLLRSSVCAVCFFSFCFEDCWLLPWFGVRSLLVGIRLKLLWLRPWGGRGRIYAGARYPDAAET